METKLRVAVIGGGYTGLSAAYYLGRAGHTVTLFEKEATLGGLAIGWKQPSWKWSLEKAYHHLFTNDSAIISLLADLEKTNLLIKKRPLTATLWNDKMYALDSATSLFLFPGLSFMEKVRTAILLAFLKINPSGKILEGITAEKLFRSIGGQGAWRTIWEPLMVGKFGTLAPSVAASWLWARVKKRTPSLYYIQGGFQTIVDELTKAITKQEGTIVTNSQIISIKQNNVTMQQGNKVTIKQFDKILLTIPTPLIAKLVPTLEDHLKQARTIPHLHAQVLVLETKKPILDSVYWLNITERSYPFLAVVGHTNMIDTHYYGDNHITYIGNYLPAGHPYLTMTKEQLMKKFTPYLKRLMLNRELKIVNSHLFTAPFAQPVHEVGYSKKAPPLKTPIPNLYIANLDSIYPWDRGTNYAVELGKKAAEAMLS